ncbi:hypothetical protein GCM10028807_20800 [Spirosoma daeguense]
MLLSSTKSNSGFWSLIWFVGLLFFSVQTKAQVTLSLEYTEQNNTTTMPAGGQLFMEMKYSASSTTTSITGAKMVLNLPDQIIAADNFVGTTHAPVANFVFTNTPGAKKLEINFISPLPSGSNGTLNVRLYTANGNVPNGTVLPTTAEFTSNGGFTSGPKNYSVTLTAGNPMICGQKTVQSAPTVDNNITYLIRVTGRSSTNNYVADGYLNATNITVQDTLPTGATFISAELRRGGSTIVPTTITQSGSIITATIPDLIATRTGADWTVPDYGLFITVRYNTANGFAVGQTIQNRAGITFTPFGGTPVHVSHGMQLDPGACVNDLDETSTLAAPNVEASFSKTLDTGQGTTIPVGQNIDYCLNFRNSGNVELANVEIIEEIPATLRYVGRTGNVSGVDHIEYQTNVSSTWQTLTLAGPGPVAGDPSVYYTRLKFVLVSPFPANTSLSNFNGGNNCLVVRFSRAPGTPDNTVVTNCASWSSTTSGIPASRTSCAPSVTLAAAQTTAQAFVRTTHAPACAGPYPIGQIFTQVGSLSALVSGTGIENPVLMMMPEGAGYFEYVPNSAIVLTAFSSLTVTPTFEYIPNYAGTGRPLLRWTYPAGTVLPSGGGVSVEAKFRLTNVGLTGHVLRFYTSGTNIGAYHHYNGSPSITQIDQYDLNNNGRTTDTLGTQATAYWSCGITVRTSASMESVKWVKGQLDSDYSRYPASGLTVRGGKADYKLIVKNTGNIPMKNVAIVDILPFINDKGVIDLSNRDTQWRPNLAAPISAPTGITVYYSTAQNPCRDEMKSSSDPSPFPTGCTPANWSTVPPSDITTVQSLKFDFGTIVVNPGDSLQLTWPMRAPIDAPANGEIAWNSFGFVATRNDNNVTLLAAEPIKVGISLAAPAPAYYGDFVWYDTNHNGLQDPGEQGVDGVKVILFQDNGDNVANPATDTEIAFTITGNGGKYLFPNLTPGNYYAVFFPPVSYSVSPANQGTNDAIDSDGTATTYLGAPAYITSITTLDALEEDLSWDLGIYCGITPSVTSNSPVTIGGTVSLSASGGATYNWTGPNNFVSTTQNPTIPNATTANAGVYKVNINSAEGCYASLLIDVIVQNCVKPNAGSDVRICAPVTSATVVAAAAGQTWAAQAGNPASATITQGGQVAGMTANGTYNFILSVGVGCSDTVQVIRSGLSLAITPGTCNTATNQYNVTGTVSLTGAQAGTLTITDGIISTTAAVATSTTAVSFSLVGLATGSGSHTVTATLSSCGTASTTYAAPASCTVGVAISATPGACVPATNQYSISGTLSLTNATAGTATITDGISTTTVSVSAGATSVPYTLVGLNSGTGSHTVTVSYASKTASATYTAPVSCTLGVALVITPSACIPATNQYALTGTLSLTNAQAGTATFTDGATSTTVAVAAGATSVSFSLTGLNSGTGSHTLVASFNGNTQSQTYTAPASCTIGVAISATPGVCVASTNSYSVSGTLSLTNATAGTATITDGAVSTTVTISAGATSVAYSLTGLTSGTGSHTVTVSYANKTASTTYAAPASCSVNVAVSVTPGVCVSATNQYSVSGTLSLTNAIAGTATITDGTATTTVSVSAGATSVPYTLAGLNSGTGSHTVTVSYASRTVSVTYTAPVSCTVAPPCALNVIVTPGVCNSATNQYALTGSVSAVNASGSQLVTITSGTRSTTVTLTGNGPASFTLTGLSSDGVIHSVVASATSCGQTSTTYTAPASCTLGMALSVTPGVCQSATNSYTITGTLSLTNATAGTATITDGAVSTTVAITAGATSVPYSLTGLASGTGSHTVTVTFAGQTASTTYTAPVSCQGCPPAQCIPILILRTR